jgi:hypothetical protein
VIGRILSLLTIPLMGLTVWGLIRQVRTEQRIGLASPLIGAVFAPLALALNVFFLQKAYWAGVGRTLPLLLRSPGLIARFVWTDGGIQALVLGPGLLLVGLGFGLAWGQATRLHRKGEALVAKRSMLHLLFWGLSYAATQLLSTLAPAQWVLGGLAAMFLSTGTTLGTNLNLLLRQLWLRRPRSTAGQP